MTVGTHRYKGQLVFYNETFKRERNYAIYAARSGGRTYTDIGREFGISRNRVIQICEQIQRDSEYRKRIKNARTDLGAECPKRASEVPDTDLQQPTVPSSGLGRQ